MSPAHAADFEAFAVTTARRAPLYARLSTALAGMELPGRLFEAAPPPARVPVNLFAAVHHLLLAQPDVPLARFYASLTPEPDRGDPVPAFIAFCEANAEAISELVATRLPQTNELGRSALLLAGFGALDRAIRDRHDPDGFAHLDVGASAGVNLQIDRLAYADGRGNRLGESAIELRCEVRGERPGVTGRHGLADALPRISDRLGLDASPIDPADAAAARWLRACVWPDQADRSQRLEAALRLVAADPPRLLAGDAVADLAEAVASLGAGMPVVTTSWVLCYLGAPQQREFPAELGRLAAGRDLAWIWAEAPERVVSLPVTAELATSPDTILGISWWRAGSRTDLVLARCHPHGYWLEWL